MLLSGTAQAQTPVTSIENAAGDSVFISFEDGALLGLGEQYTGVIPIEGAGTRMMWYPAKSAFRAGYVSGTQWDDVNIGIYSTAMGLATTASGFYSTAMGSNTIASGNYSTAMGSNTNASEDYSTAMGEGTTASGFYSTAMGRSTIASGLVSTAMGFATTASGNYSTAMGYITTASGTWSTVMGYRTTAASAHSLSIGEYNSANTSADGTLFVVGNGSFSTPSDALVLDDAGNMTIAGTLTESSDRRLKTNISPIGENTLGKLSNITPSTFEFKNQQTHPAGQQLGLIAQEVQQQFPELVSEASNGNLSVSYSKFTAVLLKGMQEQQEEITALKKENNSIKERLAKLEQQHQQTAGMPWYGIVMLLTLLIGGGLVMKRNNSFSRG